MKKIRTVKQNLIQHVETKSNFWKLTVSKISLKNGLKEWLSSLTKVLAIWLNKI